LSVSVVALHQSASAIQMANVEVTKSAEAETASTEAPLPAGFQNDSPVVVKMATAHSLSGVVLASVCPVPPNILQLKIAFQEQTSTPVALQKLVEFEGTHIYQNDEDLSGESLKVYMMTDETPLFSWDLDSNPDKAMLDLEGSSIVTCPRLRTDYLNVLTKEPLSRGVHYFEFVMHHIGDEQWCGLVKHAGLAGTRTDGRSVSAQGWTYYCGRMRSTSGSIRDGKGALHAEGCAVKEFQKVRPSGDVIGMLADLKTGAIAFDLNGELQGACAIPTDTPLWVLTHLDTPKDKVELRKPCLAEAPPANLEALQGALLEISLGEQMRTRCY